MEEMTFYDFPEIRIYQTIIDSEANEFPPPHFS